LENQITSHFQSKPNKKEGHLTSQHLVYAEEPDKIHKKINLLTNTSMMQKKVIANLCQYGNEITIRMTRYSESFHDCL